MSTSVSALGVEFVPMIKEPGNTMGRPVSELPRANQGGIGRVVKGWNEPDDPGQAGHVFQLRSDPEAYAQAWTSDMQVARSRGYTEFIGPAMAHDTCWLDYFLKACESTTGCKDLVTYLAFHRYRSDCSSYSADPGHAGWRDDLSYVLTYHRLMEKYNARGFNIKGLVWDELGCLSSDWYTPAPERDQLRYMQQLYQLTVVGVKNQDAQMIGKIKATPWIMPKGPDAHAGQPYSLGMCTAQDGGPTAGIDAVKAIHSLVTVAWFSILPGLNHLFQGPSGQGLSELGKVYFDACMTVSSTPAPTPAPTADPLANALVKIVNEACGQALYANPGHNWEAGVGVQASTAQNSVWRLVPTASGGYKIISEAANRVLYAADGFNWDKAVGAGGPPSVVGGDGVWSLVPQAGTDRYRLVNTQNDRALYAAVRESGATHVGAGSPSNAVGSDGVWSVQVQTSTNDQSDPFDGAFVRITSLGARRALYAQVGLNWEQGIGAGMPASTVGGDGVWQLLRSDEGGYRIVNRASNRALYAQNALSGLEGLGAGNPPADVTTDGVWKLIPAGGSGRYRIINVASDRCLYALVNGNWADGMGAASPSGSVGDEGIWEIEFEG